MKGRRPAYIPFLLLALLLSGLLAACGDTAASTGTPANPTTSTQAQATATPVKLLPVPTTSQVSQSAAVSTTTVAAATSSAAAATTAAQTTPTTTQASRPLPAGLAGKLSIVGTDNQLYVQRFDGKGQQLLLGQAGVDPAKTGDGTVYTFPTWTRDGSKLAVMSAHFTSGTIDSYDVWVVNKDGTGANKVRDGGKTGGVYLNFSPDGNSLTMLVGGNGTLELQIADTSAASRTKPANPRVLLEGQPLYTSWAPNNDNLVVHNTLGPNDNLSIISTRNANAQRIVLPGTPGFFRAPAWSPDGSQLAYSVAGATANDPEALIVANKDGKEEGRFTGAGSSLSFNWSPDGKRLIFTSQIQAQGVYQDIYMADLTTLGSSNATSTKIVSDAVLGYFWSPDSKKLAYVSLNDTASMFIWKVFNFDTGKSTDFVEWVPTDATAQILAYFDQYAQSDSLWSPDSKALVFGGWDKTALSQGTQPGDPNVYVLMLEGPNAGQSYVAGQGSLAFWAK